MWFLVIAAPALLGTVSTLISMTGGGKFILAGFLLDQYQRRAGYSGGEGWASDRPEDVYIVPGLKNPDSPISEAMGRMAALNPQEFAPFVNKKYDMTVREVAFLNSLIMATEPFLVEVSKNYLDVFDNPEDQEAASRLSGSLQVLKVVQRPLLHFLNEFPHARVKPVLDV